MDAQCAKVLIIDRDEARCRLAAEALAGHSNGMKFDVQCLPSCDEAMSVIQKEHFDAVGFDCTQDSAAGSDWIEGLRLLSLHSAVIALGEAYDHGGLPPGRVDDSVPTGTPDAWRMFAGRVGQAIRRHQAEKALRQACGTFEAIIRNAPGAIVCVSPDGRIVEFNARAEALWGLSRAVAVGADFLETCFSQQERFRVNCEMQLLSPGESAHDLRSFITLSDGRQATLSWDFSFASTENGVGALFIAVAHEPAELAGTAPGDEEANRVPFNAHFNDTVDLVLHSLGAIMERIDCIKARTTPAVLDRLRSSYDDTDSNGHHLPPRTAAAVERLILGLIAEQKQEC